MDKIIIEGQRRLNGEVRVSGSKNAALPLMATAILANGPLTLHNMPNLIDLTTMARLLTYMGGQIEIAGGRAELNLSVLSRPEAPYELVKTMRASALVLGPLLTRHGRARVSLPGGCAIGARPIDLHLKALESMGAIINLSGGYVLARAPVGGLYGAHIHFDTVTVTGTENLMMAATLARGRTIITGAAREPEITDTALALLAMGAKISGIGTDELIIDGVDTLHSAAHTIMPDRIEAGTLIVAVALAGGKVLIQGTPNTTLKAVYEKISEAGVELAINESNVMVTANGPIKSVDVTTRPYPGFPTDMQAQFMALMTIGHDVSIINETIFENRFMHISELSRLGADITLEGHAAVIKGVSRLSGAPMMATDLRASASLILAALAAGGKSEILRVYHLDRGYDRLDEKLSALGARITRIKA
ncbi:MAG: UDP-N-acetylglucosamine 1-carboxyvinyltransferase [Candidatus Adiutrix intracellularis]|jgi:UDP-N-acetylglucosamine 1-carboxyvinyltransferase|nr:UDP-N-acetylglucosamine 1-carboxyvinyltransferase [Candidatus Adiutrix intracellularis]